MTTENVSENAAHEGEMTTEGAQPVSHPGIATAKPPEQPQRPAPDFAWMRVPTQRGMRPKPGPDGLTLDIVESGDYRYVPDVWPHKNDLPPGAYPAPNQDSLPQASYSLFEKAEVWSENCRVLYEDAIRDRWASATDVPWETLEPNPEHIERAICQICTQLSEQAYVTVQVFSGWLERIAYGFHAVKDYLATQIYDNARHVEAFRKRALANDGGLGLESPGIYHKALTSSMRFTELVIFTNIVRGTFNLVALETLKGIATSDAEHVLYGNAIRDIKRHVDFGVGHLAFLLSRQPRMLGQVHGWLSRAEFFLVADQRRDTAYTEAFILLLGETAEAGRARYEEVRRTWVAYYLNRLADARIFDRVEKLAPEIARYAPEGVTTPMTVSMRPDVEDPAF